MELDRQQEVEDQRVLKNAKEMMSQMAAMNEQMQQLQKQQQESMKLFMQLKDQKLVKLNEDGKFEAVKGGPLDGMKLFNNN